MERTFDERVLDFLDGGDGSLPRDRAEDDAVRESLLREASESAEKRRSFAAFVRLRSVLNSAQKPSSAPLALQRELARKLPVLALHLPYLAEEDKRERAAAFWVSWTKATRIAMSVALIATIGVALFFGLRHTSRDHVASVSSSPQDLSTPSSSPTIHERSETASAPSTPSNALANASARAGSGMDDAPSATTNLTSGVGSSSHGVARDKGASHRAANNRTRSGQSAAQGIGLNEGRSNGPILDPSAASTPTVDKASAQSTKTEKGSGNAAAPPIESQQPKVAMLDGAKNTKLALSIEPVARLQFLPNVTLASPTASREFGSLGGTTFGGGVWLTAEREVGTTISLGARVGYIRAAQMQSITYAEPTPGYPLLKRYQRETRLRDTMSLVFGPSAGLHLSVGEMNGELRLYGAFSASIINWMLGADLGAEFPLSAKFGVRGSVGFDLTSSAVAAPAGQVLPDSYTIGVRDVGSPASALISPAISISVGIQYRP